MQPGRETAPEDADAQDTENTMVDNTMADNDDEINLIQESAWLTMAIDNCSKAANSGLTVMLTRTQNGNDGIDIVITNASSPEMLAALHNALD